jgi:hypothetical protein
LRIVMMGSFVAGVAALFEAALLFTTLDAP